MAEASSDTPTTPGPSTKQRGSGFGRALRVFVLPALIGAVVSTSLIFVPLAGWSGNDVTTGRATGYPDLQPRRYDATVENATLLAAATASRLSKWKVLHTFPKEGRMEAEAPTFLPPFKDDVLVTITAVNDPNGASDRASEVVIRSHSRSGRPDLGENARHIRALQTAMDSKLPRLDASPDR